MSPTRYFTSILAAQFIMVMIIINPACGNPLMSTLNHPHHHIQAHKDPFGKDTFDFRVTGGGVKQVNPQLHFNGLDVPTSEKDTHEETIESHVQIRQKRSPYPPGYVIWSPPSEPLPCHCIPGARKCRCLKLLERLAYGKGKIPVVFRKRGQAISH